MVKKVNKNPLWRYAGSNWWRYLIGLTSLVMSVLFDIWFPLITMSIVDDVIIGGDMLFSFEKWYKYESLLKETRVCAAARDDDSLVDMMEYANEIGRVKVLPTKAVTMSSTEVREAAAAGKDISGMVPAGVADYIREKGLYR